MEAESRHRMVGQGSLAQGMGLVSTNGEANGELQKLT